MASFIITVSIGIIIAVLGIINMRGNISTLHSYHRSRVTEENVRPFGRLVGLGTLIIGAACIIYGTLFWIFELTNVFALLIISIVQLFCGLGVGIAITFYAMKKYNGGIF